MLLERGQINQESKRKESLVMSVDAGYTKQLLRISRLETVDGALLSEVRVGCYGACGRIHHDGLQQTSYIFQKIEQPIQPDLKKLQTNRCADVHNTRMK